VLALILALRAADRAFSPDEPFCHARHPCNHSGAGRVRPHIAALGLGVWCLSPCRPFSALAGNAVAFFAKPSTQKTMKTLDDRAVPHPTAPNQDAGACGWVAFLVMVLARLVIGALSLRTSGAVHFIMITLALRQIDLLFLAFPGRLWRRDGFVDLCPATRSKVSNTLPPRFFLLCYAVLISGACLQQWKMTGARFGIALQRRPARMRAALRHSDCRHTESKLAAFVISGMVTGLAGALYADLKPLRQVPR